MDFRIVFYLSFSFLLITCGKATAQEVDYSNEYQIVANVTGLTELNISELRQRFKGKYYSWDKNIDVIIALPSSKHINAEEVSRIIYDKSFYGVKKFWLSLVFQGRFNAPNFFDSDDEIVDFISKNEGSIGFVSKKVVVPEKFVITLSQ